jgi:hypothetical protein
MRVLLTRLGRKRVALHQVDVGLGFNIWAGEFRDDHNQPYVGRPYTVYERTRCPVISGATIGEVLTGLAAIEKTWILR